MRIGLLAVCITTLVISTVGEVKAQRPITEEERQAVVSALITRIAELEVKRIDLLITHSPTAEARTTLETTLLNLRWRLADMADPDFVRPAAPRDVRARPGNGEVQLEWSPVEGIKHYKIFYWYYGIPWTVAGESSTPRFTVTGLTNDRSYVFAVSAIRPKLNSQWGDSLWGQAEAIPQSKLSLTMPGQSASTLQEHAQKALAEQVPGSYTAWMSFQEYQADFERLIGQRMYPARVEGRKGYPLDQFRVLFQPMPEYAAGFATHHGRGRGEYQTQARHWSKAGYKQVWLQIFKDKNGIERYQAVWLRYV